MEKKVGVVDNRPRLETPVPPPNEEVNVEDTYRAIALNIKNKLKDWFTQSQVVGIYGREQAPQIIQMLEFLGLLKSETMHGAWKHRIIQVPSEREVLLRSNIAHLKIQMAQTNEQINLLEGILEDVVKEG